MDDSKRLRDHHTFMVNSDRKSLYTQLKRLVQRAQEIGSQELNDRRKSLKLLLEAEETIYEKELVNKMQARMDESIKERKDNLLKIKEENMRNEFEFLQSKRIQQYMNSCYEIREALRRKETHNIKECQLEQMLEKERDIQKELDIERYWLKVQENNLTLMDERQRQENCLKEAVVKHVAATRQIQMKELQEKRKKECQEKLEEKNKLNALAGELRSNKNPSEVIEYRNELLKMIKNKEAQKAKEKEEGAEMRRKLMKEVAIFEAEESIAAKEKKKAFHKAITDFITFSQEVRKLEQQKLHLQASQAEELRRIDLCTKNNILLERERKARIAEQCFAALREQICEQYKSRLREEAEYKENKILENHFARHEITRAEICANQQRHRLELDKQIKELKQIREAEDVHFSHELKRASNDAAFCSKLAEKYLQEGIDYLQPHPNRFVLTSVSGQTVPEPLVSGAEKLSGQRAIPKTSFEPCVCIASVVRNAAANGRGEEKL